MRRTLRTLSLSLLCSSALAGESSFTQGIAVAARVQPFPAAKVEPRSFADGVVRHAGLQYSGSSQTLDLYLPAKPAQQRPLIIYVHGGGWEGGDARSAGVFEDFPALLARLAAQGYAVASVNYRLSGEAPFPAALEDVKAALDWLHRKAPEYRIDPQRVALWGSSAGGHLAALGALTCQSAACPKVLVSWFGIFDMQRIVSDPAYPAIDAAARRFLGCAGGVCDETTLKAASPITQIAPVPPATLLIHGTRDKVVPHSQSQWMSEALPGARLLLIPGVGHSFVGEDQRATEAANYQALEVTLAFLHQHL